MRTANAAESISFCAGAAGGGTSFYILCIFLYIKGTYHLQHLQHFCGKSVDPYSTFDVTRLSHWQACPRLDGNLLW